MYVTMNRCGHLCKNIPYSKHCPHCIQISCHSQSQSHSHIRLLQFSNQRSFNCFHALNISHDSSHYHCWSTWSMQPSSNCQFLMRNATHWPRIKMRSVTHCRPYKCVIFLPYCAKMWGTRNKKTLLMCTFLSYYASRYILQTEQPC